MTPGAMHTACRRLLRAAAGLLVMAALLLVACDAADNGGQGVSGPVESAGDGAQPSVRTPTGSISTIGVRGPVLAERGELPEPPGGARLLWRASGKAAVTAGPVAADGTVVAGFADGTVIAWSLTNGAEAWRMVTQSIPVAASVSRLGVVVADLGSVKSLELASGAVMWEADVPAAFGGGLLATSRAIYAVRADGAIVALDPESGGLLWTAASAPSGNGSAPAPPAGPPVAFEGVLYVVDVVGTLRAYSTSDGSARPATLLNVNPVSPPARYGSALVVTSSNGSVVRVDPAAGVVEPVVAIPEPVLVSAVPNGEELYLAGAAGSLYRMGAGGEIELRYAADADLAGLPALLDTHVLFADAGGRLHGVPVDAGGLQWSLDVGVRLAGGPAYLDGVLLMGSAKGEVLAVVFDREPATVPVFGSERSWSIPAGGAFSMAGRRAVFIVEPETSEVREWTVSSTDPDDEIVLTVTDEGGTVIATNMGKVALGESVRAAVSAGERYRLRVERTHIDPDTVLSLRVRVID
jgi:outer membrane protein assembly factor BamB